MEAENGFDWISFIVNFMFAAIPTLFLVGGLVWRFSPYTKGSTVLLIASITAFIIGLVAGIWRSHFWDAASTIGSHTPYTRKRK
jgi:hypothetical protein